MRPFLTVLFAIVSSSCFAESIVCVKDLTLSSLVGTKKGNNGIDRYRFVGGSLEELVDGRVIWRYSIVSEKDNLIVGALRQDGFPSDTQMVLIDRVNRTLTKTVSQGSLRFTTFGLCTFSK